MNSKYRQLTVSLLILAVFLMISASWESAAAQGTQKVEVFVTSWCPYCVKLEKLLKEKKIRYTRYDIEDSETAHRKYLQLGGGGIPITKIGSTVIPGFQPEWIMRELGVK